MVLFSLLEYLRLIIDYPLIFLLKSKEFGTYWGAAARRHSFRTQHQDLYHACITLSPISASPLVGPFRGVESRISIHVSKNLL